MIYLVIANSSLLFFYMIYVLFLRKLTFFQWNRTYLLSALVLSFLIPIIQLMDLGMEKKAALAVFTMPVIDLSASTANRVLAEQPTESNWVFIVYAMGCLVAILLFMYKLLQLRKSVQSTVSAQRSFSFFNKIVIDADVVDPDLISRHEQVHARQKHSLDVLIIEFFRVFNWFNPVFHFYLKEIKFQHECIADAICAEDNKIYYAELLVANAMQVSPSAISHHFSSSSYLKKRIMYLFKNKTKKINQLRYGAVLPVMLAMAVLSVACNENNKKVAENSDSSEQVVVDNQATNHPQSITTASADSTAPTVEQIKFPEPKVVSNTSNQVKSSVSKSSIEKQEEEIAPENKNSTSDETANDNREDKLFTSVQVSPEPEGGMAAFRNWIAQNYSYPQGAIDAGVKGTIDVIFTVEKDGSLTDF